MNDKDIRQILREWVENTVGGQIEDEITVSGYRIDIAALADFITGFEIKGDSDALNCPHFKDQIEGYSRVCRHSFLIITTNRPKALKIALDILPWYWGIAAVDLRGAFGKPKITVARYSHDSPELDVSTLLRGLHKRELTAMLTKADAISPWKHKDDIIKRLQRRIPTRRAEALLSKSLRSSNFRVRNIRKKIAKRQEAAVV
jgi:hypothetical protein